MSKRFTCTNKWKKTFLRGLEGAYKLLWFYILDDCDHAGIWHVEFDIARLRIGKDMFIDKDVALKIFKDKIIVFDNGEKWFIPNFVDFQYGELNPDNRAHKSVINLLKKYKLFKGYVSSLQGAMDKDKEQDKDKDKEGEEKKKKEKWFLEVYNKYPKRDSKKKAEQHFNASVKNEKDYVDICKALDNYLKSERVRNNYIKSASTWFNNWQDWIDFKDTGGGHGKNPKFGVKDAEESKRRARAAGYTVGVPEKDGQNQDE